MPREKSANWLKFTHQWAVNFLLLLSLALLLIGLINPILTLEQFYFLSNSVSLWSALEVLAAEKEWGLFVLIGTFSVVFPALKLLMLFAIWNLEDHRSARHAQHLRWLEIYSKWSMLDVFVVALLVVAVKLSALAEARVEFGIYAFAGSVIMTMLLSNWIGRQTGK